MAGGAMVWAARAIPTVLIVIIGYVSWVVTHVVVCKTFSLRRPIARSYLLLAMSEDI